MGLIDCKFRIDFDLCPVEQIMAKMLLDRYHSNITMVTL